jgi:transposase InsO family protein
MGLRSRLSELGSAIGRLGLRQIFTRPYTPKTNGELLNWLHRYNWHRPHGSLKANTPISRLGLSEDNLLRLHS